MEFREVVNGRKSIRKYRPDPVPREDVLDIVDVATRAANAGNKQTWRFYAISNRDLISRMRDAVDSETRRLKQAAGVSPETDRFAVFFSEAPLVIAVASAPYRSGMDEIITRAGVPENERTRRRQRPDIQSVGACVQMLLCAAHEKGYGACWMTAPMIARAELERLLDIEPPLELCALVPIGRPAEDPPKTTRLPVDRVLKFID